MTTPIPITVRSDHTDDEIKDVSMLLSLLTNIDHRHLYVSLIDQRNAMQEPTQQKVG